jgi:hypothetical protein
MKITEALEILDSAIEQADGNDPLWEDLNKLKEKLKRADVSYAFKGTNGDSCHASLSDVLESGTPIDPDTGDDLEIVIPD